MIFDLHLDLAWNALTWRRDLTLPLGELNRREQALQDAPFRGRATVCLPELRAAGAAVVLGTTMGRVPYGESELHASTLDFPTHAQVYAFARGQLGYYEALEQTGHLRLIRTATELQQHWQQCSGGVAEPTAGTEGTTTSARPLGLILAMEGADAILSPEQVPHWFDLGLRCASLVHYGTSAYAVGTGQEGPLSQRGQALLQAFQQVGMVLDVTHLSDTSFAEALDHFDGPVCASHQACRAIVDHQRQFSDDQIRRVLQRGGILGVPCDAWMLSPGWIRGETDRAVLRIDCLVDQVDHICQLAGNAQQVAIGSDLDGGFGSEQTPTGLDAYSDLARLAQILAQRGYTDRGVRGVMGGNAFEFFQRNLPA